MYIIEPLTNHKYHINSKIGGNILRRYIKNYQLGGVNKSSKNRFKYPEHIITSLKWYSGSEYDRLNDKLRTNKQLSPEIDIHWKYIQEAFKLSPGIKSDMTVYRGTRGDETIYNVVTPLSTSKVKRGTQDFVGGSCCLFVITVPKGTKLIDMDTYSDIQSEYEILLPLGKLKYEYEEIESIEFNNEKKDMKLIYVTYVPNDKYIEKISESTSPSSSTNKLTKQEEVANKSKEKKVLTDKDIIDNILRIVDEEEYELITTLDDAKYTIESVIDEMNNDIKKEITEDIKDNASRQLLNIASKTSI